MGENLPGEDLDILLDVSRLGVRETHNTFEEVFAVSLGLGDCQGTESFQVAADSVLLFHGEANSHESLQEVYCVDTCDKALFLLFPVDAADGDIVDRAILWRDGLEGRTDRATIL